MIALPGKATIVAPYDQASTVSAQQVVAGLHELAARLAVPLLAEEHLAAMAGANARFEQALQAAEVESALRADDDFHAVFVTVSGNPVLRELLEQTTPVLRRVERMRFGSFAARESVAQHAEIIRLARLGDAEAAARACRENWLSLRFTSAEDPPRNVWSRPGQAWPRRGCGLGCGLTATAAGRPCKGDPPPSYAGQCCVNRC